VPRVRAVSFVLFLAMLAVACEATPSPRSTATAVPAVATAAPAETPMQRGTPSAGPTGTRTPVEAVSASTNPPLSATPTATQMGITPTFTDTIGTLTIPALDRRIPIVSVGWEVDEIDGMQVAIWETVAGAAGHHRGTAPLGGEGNCVLSGHSSAEQGAVLEGLWDLTVGDKLLLTDAAGAEHSYRITSVDKIQEMGASLEDRLAHAAAMDSTDDARLTLITCWPPWAYTHRVIVIALREDAG